MTIPVALLAILVIHTVMIAVIAIEVFRQKRRIVAIETRLERFVTATPAIQKQTIRDAVQTAISQLRHREVLGRMIETK